MRCVGNGAAARVDYYQDIDRKWAFRTDRRRGLSLLAGLVRTCNRCLQRNQQLLDRLANPKEAEQLGEHIYRNKPTFKRTKDSKEFGDSQFVTWSQEEYGQAGLQRKYLKLKSYQRFTEAWSLVERADARGLFDEALAGVPKPDGAGGTTGPPVTLRIASIGGGPGFELYAVQEYFRKKKQLSAQQLRLELTSLDLENSWGEYVRLMGFRFVQWDLRTGGLVQKLGYGNSGGGPQQLNFVIISAVMEMYMANENCCDWLANLLLEEGVTAALIDSRSQELKAHKLMRERNVTAVALLPGGDERQSVLLGKSARILEEDHPRAREVAARPVFPNVPFSEHKKARQEGGHRLGWRPFHDR